MRTWVAPLILAMALVGCQDDSTNSSSSSKPGLPEYGGGGKLDPNLPSNKIQGQLVDPYVADALVCLDESDNGVCDAGELTTRSDANGVFTFTLNNALSSAAQLLVINEGSLQYPHYGRHVGNDFHIALNAKLARGNNSMIITPAVSAKNLMGTSTTELATVLNENFGNYFAVTFTAADLEVDPFADMIVADHARFVEVQKAQQVISALLLIFQHAQGWDGYYDFVNDFVANAAEPQITDTKINSDGSVTTTKEDKPLYDLLLALVKQANAQSVNVLPTASSNDLLAKGNALIETMIDSFEKSMPSGPAYTPLPSLNDGVKANISAAYAEYFMETLNSNTGLLAVFADESTSTSTFSARLKTLASSVTTLLTTQAIRNNSIMAELTSKFYFTSNEVQHVLNGDESAPAYSATQLTLLANKNQYFESVASCALKRFYLGGKATVTSGNVLSSISFGLSCADNTFSAAESAQLLESFGQAVEVNLQHMASIPAGSEILAKGGCTIKGTLSTAASASLTPVYLKNAATGEVLSQFTDNSAGFAFKGLPIPAAVDGFSGYYFGTYAGVRGGYAGKVAAQTIKEVPVSCVAGETQTLAVTLPDVGENTMIDGSVASALLGDDLQIWLEQDVADLISGTNTLEDDNVEAVWIGEIIEEDTTTAHPYMTFNKTTGEFTVTHMAVGDYRLRILSGGQEIISNFFRVQSTTSNTLSVSAAGVVSETHLPK
jgi:hypothetical protein